MTDVSVIIPAYNEEDTIRACVESVANQETELDYEIIVCDDSSTDDTAPKLEVLSRRHDNLKLAETQSNGGILNALNKAFAKCSGGYILRIDADCLLKPGSLDAFYHRIQDADIVYGKVHVENTDKLHPAACQLGKENGSAAWFGGACVGFQDHVIHDLNGFMGVRQNLEREVMNRAQAEEWTVEKVDDVAVDSVFPELIREWLPRKLSSGGIYVRECADSPQEFEPWELRGPAVWTVVTLLSLLSLPVGLLAATIIGTIHFENGKTVAQLSGKDRYLLFYPLYMIVGGFARTVGVWKEAPLLAKTLWGKYA